MLQFIVLGQIPGTSVQINFYGFVLVVMCSVFAAAGGLYLQDRRRRENLKQLLIALKYF